MRHFHLAALCLLFLITIVGSRSYQQVNNDEPHSSRSLSTTRPVDAIKKKHAFSIASEATIDIPIRQKIRKSRENLHKLSSNVSSVEEAALNGTSVNVSEIVSNTSTLSSGWVQTSLYKVNTKQLFYMYDLGEEYWWRWPMNGTDCSENGYVGHEHAQYSGMGPPILPDDGLFLTWHFSLFSSLYNRMKRSSRRTLDPEKASLFIIPYDLGLDGYLNPWNCQNRRSCTRGLVDKLTAMLDKSKYFQRYQGGDHAVLWSLGQYHPWPRERCDIFMMTYCARCTFTCYWMDPTKKDNKFISVPFPSGYHYHDDIKNLPWDVSRASQRNLTAVYLGSTQTLNPAHTKIRRAMTAQCNASSECHWLQIAHNSKDNNIADFLSIYKKSVFCLCPPGDDPARKAVFDAIISGCIPVIFEVATLYNQYPWHIGEQNALDISVAIPGGAVRSGKLDFMSVLLGISPEVIRKKQEALARIAPRVQYAIPPIDSLQDKYSTEVWDPPFPDGVEITLDGLFERTGHVIRNESTGIPHRLQTGREWAQEYDVVKVQVPKPHVPAEGEIVPWAGMSAKTKTASTGASTTASSSGGASVEASSSSATTSTTGASGTTAKTGEQTVTATNSVAPTRDTATTATAATATATTATAATTAKPANSSKPLFYMYDLEEAFWWRWPVNGTDCSENGYVGHEHAQYSGMGPPILPDDGLFLTWHFSLFSSLYNRMKRSSRRTLDPEKASLFIIPYDLGLDGYLNPWNCQNRRSCTRGLVDKLTAILDKSKYFQRYQGGDHAVLWSLGQYHPYPHEKCDIFMRFYCERCTFTSYWMDPTKKDNKFISVPFPSGYHYHDEIKNLPWDLSLAPHRNLTAVYLGSIQTLNPTHTKVRRAMTAQCNVSSECHWLQISHNSKDNSIADFLSIYKKSVFCLCPPGDDPARKAVFDAIISGCIPVIFEVATLYNQYPWHIGEQNALDISVSIPGAALRSGKIDFMSVLLAISPEVIRKKQEALARIAPRVQYAIPPIDSLRDKYSTEVWDPPFPDGVEITLDGLFERTGHVIRNESTGIPHRLQTGKEWGQEYDVVRVQVPKKTVIPGEIVPWAGMSSKLNPKPPPAAAVSATSAATSTAATAGAAESEEDAEELQRRVDKTVIAASQSRNSEPAGSAATTAAGGVGRVGAGGKHRGPHKGAAGSAASGGGHNGHHRAGGGAAVGGVGGGGSVFGAPGEEENEALKGGTGDFE